MDFTNEFDKKVSRPGTPEHFQRGATETNDTLELAWASVRCIFGEQAKPEHALELLPIMLRQAEARYRQALASHLSPTDGE